MHWQFTPYVLPLIVSTVMAVVLAIFIWRRRTAPGGTMFWFLTLAAAEWSLAYALELVSADLPTALFWNNIAWFGAAVAPTLWFAFVLQYTGRARWLTRRTTAMLVIEPFITLLLIWVREFRSLLESVTGFDSSGSLSTLVTIHGPWYWIDMTYSYLLVFVGAILIFQTLMRSARLYFGQIGALLIALLIPWVGNALTAFGLSPLPRLDLTPFAFTISGVAVGWSLFRFRLLDIVPVAYETIFEEAPIGMALLSLDGVLLQVNKAFCEMVGYSERELAGRRLASITHPDDSGKDQLLVSQMARGKISSYKVEKRYLRKDRETLCADLTATILRNRDGRAIYGLVMLENIIARKQAQLLEEEKHHVAYELHDGLAQVATSAYLHLQAFASHYRPCSLQAHEELERALELAQRSIKEARQLIAGLRPTALADFGLATALRLQVEALRAEGWTIQYEETLDAERLLPSLETTLFGIGREALTNIRKHAGTTEARVALERQASVVRLEVQDWGRGFEPVVVPGVCSLGEHIGLREMRERVSLVGGRLMISSKPGAGTLVVAEAPFLPCSERRNSCEL